MFFDEFGFDSKSLKNYGRTAVGTSPNPVVTSRRQRYNVVGAISGLGHVLVESYLRKPRDPSTTMTGAKILAFLRRMTVMLKTYCDSNDVDYDRITLVMDNAGIHRTEEVMDFLDSTGFTVLFLPPYSPFLNAIEEVIVTKYDPRRRQDRPDLRLGEY